MPRKRQKKRIRILPHFIAMKYLLIALFVILAISLVAIALAGIFRYLVVPIITLIFGFKDLLDGLGAS